MNPKPSIWWPSHPLGSLALAAALVIVALVGAIAAGFSPMRHDGLMLFPNGVFWARISFIGCLMGLVFAPVIPYFLFLAARALMLQAASGYLPGDKEFIDKIVAEQTEGPTTTPKAAIRAEIPGFAWLFLCIVVIATLIFVCTLSDFFY